MRKLSVIIPCYNEASTVAELVKRVKEAPMPGWEREIIVVDDASTDGTTDILRSVGPSVQVVFRPHNGGKGTAVRDGLASATGDFILIQDADLEYDPNEIQYLLGVIDAGKADVVYGSRNLKPQEREGSLILHAGVWFLTQLVNILYHLRLTDICTCYKLFPREASDAVPSGGFESDILLGPALARRGYRFAEVPITYKPRSIAQGKKIRYYDGLFAIVAIFTDWWKHTSRVSTAPSSWFKKYRLEIFIFVLAFIVRLVFFGFSYSIQHGDLTSVVNVGDNYYELAQNIIAGHGYSVAAAPPYIPSSYRTPGMPYFIAILYSLFGSYFAVVFIQMLISSYIPVLGIKLARYLTKSHRVPLVVGIFLALEPTAALLGSELLSDTLFTFFLSLSFLSLFRFFKDANMRTLGSSALFLGISTLIRPVTLYLPILIGAFILFEARAHLSRRVFVSAGAFLLIFLLVLSPWFYRNYRTFGVLGLSSQQGAALYGVMVPSVLAIAHHSNFAKEQPIGTDALGATTFTQSADYTKRAFSILRQYPKALFLFGVNMIVSFFTFDGTYDVLHRLNMGTDLYATLTSAKVASGIPVGASTLLAIASSPLSVLRFLFALLKSPVILLLIGRLLWVLITLFFVVGVWQHLRRERTIYGAIAILSILYFALITITIGFNIAARYRLPVEPFILTFAGSGVVLVLSWSKTKWYAFRHR